MPIGKTGNQATFLEDNADLQDRRYVANFVVRDLAGATNVAPQADPDTGEILERAITGLDGKTYTVTPNQVVKAFLTPH